jgi:hypothetical protein
VSRKDGSQLQPVRRFMIGFFFTALPIAGENQSSGTVGLKLRGHVGGDAP